MKYLEGKRVTFGAFARRAGRPLIEVSILVDLDNDVQ